jgi:hypothetical protein
MFLRHLSGIGLCAALLCRSLAAQDATQAVQAAQQAELSQNVQGGVVGNSISSTESFAPASDSDADLGEQVLLQPAQKYQPFSAWTNWSVFWTNNAELLDDTQGSDTFLSGTAGFGYMPHLGGNLFLDTSAEQGMFRYSRNSSLDFNSLSVKAGLVYPVRALGDLTFYGYYTYDLLTSRGLNSQIYADHVLSVGARKVFTITRAHIFYAALNADFTVGGEPDYALRNEYSLFAGYQLSLTRNLRLDLYYRLAAQAYTQTDRTDLNQLIGGGVTFEVTKWLSVQAISTIGINSSTESTYSYFAANLGGGVGILVNF